METAAHTIEFKASGRGKARCAPNPAYPDGKELDITEGLQGCLVDLPYPAPECGLWLVKCHACERGIIAVTAAGRPDDPKNVKIPCLNRCYTPTA